MNEVTKIAPANEVQAQAAALPADPYIPLIERMAMDPSVDLDRIERMMQMKRDHDAQQAKAAFIEAFSLASAEMPVIPCNGRGHNDTTYATLEDILRLTRPALSAHGLTLSFSTSVAEMVVVTATLMHKAGHSESSSMALPRDASGSKNAVQAVGSTQKYGQRYTAQAILGLSLGDDGEDDGRGAGIGSAVSPEQYIALRDKLEESGMDRAKFHTAFGHSDPENADLAHFPAAQFQNAMQRLNKYAQAKAAQQ